MGDLASLESCLEILAVNTIHPSLEFRDGKWRARCICHSKVYTGESEVSTYDAVLDLMQKLPDTFGKVLSKD